MNSFVLKGHVLYSVSRNELAAMENAYLVCENGLCCGVFDVLPECYAHLPIQDYGDKLIIPGMVDLHQNRHALGMDSVHDALQTGDLLVAPNAQLAGGQSAHGINTGGLLNDEARPALSHGSLMGHMFIGHDTAFIAPVEANHGRHANTII